MTHRQMILLSIAAAIGIFHPRIGFAVLWFIAMTEF